jgi:hypothetical protein
MSICFFELRATAAMTMFYKNLFRVIATDNGTLQNYQNPNQTFPMADIITADGYPKLVRTIFFSTSLDTQKIFCLGLCRQQFVTRSRSACLS